MLGCPYSGAPRRGSTGVRIAAVISGLALLLLGLPTLPAHAEAVSPPGIAGTVTRQDGTPAANSQVCLYGGSASSHWTYACVDAGSDGAYLFSSSSAGAYVIGATLSQYLTTFDAGANDTADYQLASTLSYPGSALVSGVDIRLVKGALLSSHGEIRWGHCHGLRAGFAPPARCR